MTVGVSIFTQLKLDTIGLLQVLNASKAIALKQKRPIDVNYLITAIDENNRIIELIDEQLAYIAKVGQ